MSVDPDEAARRLLADAAAAAAGVARRRDVALVDLFLPAAERPSDLQRATMARLLDGLIDTIEAALRGDLPPIDGDRLAGPRLHSAGLLHDGALVAALLLRADAHRLERTLARDEGDRLLDELGTDADPAVADAAVTLAASGGARDAYLDPALPLADLSAALRARLAWAVAAALRQDVAQPDADARLAAAVTALLARAAAEDGAAAHAARLAHALDAAGRLDDELIAQAAASGAPALAAEALARRVGIAGEAVWPMLLDGDRLLLLLRAAGVARAPALRIASLFAGADAAAERADAFDALAPDVADAAIAPWRLDPDYRAALAALGGRP